jgi:hypothetical protein
VRARFRDDGLRQVVAPLPAAILNEKHRLYLHPACGEAGLEQPEGLAALGELRLRW